MNSNIPVRLNVLLTIAFVLLNVYQFLLLPLFLLAGSGWWLVTLIPCAFTSNSLWFLIHEGFHGSLHPERANNDLMGRVLAVCFGAPYHVVRFGHLMHHRFNGALIDRPDLYDPARTSRWMAVISYYWTLVGGLYVKEYLSPLIFFGSREQIRGRLDALLNEQDEATDQIRDIGLKVFMEEETIRAIRRDGIAVYALTAASLICYGSHWYMVALIFGVRAFMVSMANNLPHYALPPDSIYNALNIEMPRGLSRFILHFDRHHVHHLEPTTPWTVLPGAAAARGESSGKPLLEAALAQFGGPIPLTAFAGAEPGSR